MTCDRAESVESPRIGLKSIGLKSIGEGNHQINKLYVHNLTMTAECVDYSGVHDIVTGQSVP